MALEETNEQKLLKRASDTFIANIKSLRVLNEEIGERADEHDKALAIKKSEWLSKIFPALRRLDDARPAQEQGAASEDHDPMPERSATEDEHTDEDESQASYETLINEVVSEMKESLRDADIRAEVAQLGPLLNKQHPEQGLLLRRGALTTLISVFENLISELVQTYYLKYPASLPAEDQMLTFPELEELGSVEEARQHLVYKKTDSLLREPLEGQLEFFRKNLKIGPNLSEEEQSTLVEIFQRRNLIVHNNGVVNRHYLARISSKLTEFYDAKEGEPLATTKKYLSEAIDLIGLVGLSLSQQCWRKWEKASIVEADGVLVNETYESLKEDRLGLTVRIALLSQNLSICREDHARRVTINHAIALKKLEQIDDMKSLLNERDWSASSLQFRVALHALKDEDKALYTLLPKAVSVGEIEKWHLEQWPLFTSQRSTDRFAEILEQCFPKEEEES